jgi:hypothetical protein
MNNRLLFILSISCFLMVAIAFPFNFQEFFSLPEKVLYFFAFLGNFYIDSFGGALQSFKNLMGASVYFYSSLPVDIVFSYIKFGDVLISGAEKSVDGLAGIGSIVTTGVDKVLFYK